MRDNLPKKPHYYETGIINLDSQQGEGTHWCAYAKKGDYCLYFDSFGDLRPPREFIDYINDSASTKQQRNMRVEYNYNRLQKFNTVNCGHLCLAFLCTNAKRLF